MEDRVELYKDADAIALTRINNGTNRKIDYKRAQQVPTGDYTPLPTMASEPESSHASFPSPRRYVIERHPDRENGSMALQGRSNRKHGGICTRVFHYVVAPPIIREAQRKQHEDEEEDDGNFHINYTKATIQLCRRLLAEFLGTILFIVVFGSCAIEVGEKRLNRESAAFACGFMGLFLAFSLGSISGAHLNPIVTLAFAIRFVFPWIWIPFYFLAQFLGSIVATLFLKLLFRSDDVSFVLNSRELPIADAFLWESFLTCCMMFVILQTATKGQIIGPQAALGVSSIFIFIGLIGGKKSSVSLNPFRSIGPALVIKSSKNKDLWLFIVAPLVGMLVAVFLCGLLQGFRPKSKSELKAAQGNDEKIIKRQNNQERMDA